MSTAASDARAIQRDATSLSSVNDEAGRTTPAPGADELIRAGKVAALGELTPGLAHELNNPLLAILGLAEFLLAEAEPGSRANRRLAIVRETALELRAILRTVVAFAREPADTWGPVDLRDTIRRTLELVRRTSAARDVELVESVGADEAVVAGSRNQLAQCVLHLLTNACGALPEGGTVRIELGRRDGWATVAVSDTGTGIPAALRRRIFEPFFSTMPSSTGLGLPAARAIAERHGGTLELDGPARDAGTTFTLRIPLSAEEAAA